MIDSHAHLNDERFNEDRDEVILRAKSQGVSMIFNVGYDLASSADSIAYSDKYEGLYAMVGFHPHDAKNADEEALGSIAAMAGSRKCLAIGEIGLDYYYDLSPREVQQKVFRTQIGMARELELPVVVHSRDAAADTMRILKEERASELGGVIHAYSGSLEMALEYIKMGFFISIGGPVTFANASKLREVVAALPLERLLIETDCPYLTPVPHRGKRNEPAYVCYVARRIADIKGLDFEEVAEVTTSNAFTVFGRLPETKR